MVREQCHLKHALSFLLSYIKLCNITNSCFYVFTLFFTFTLCRFLCCVLHGISYWNIKQMQHLQHLHKMFLPTFVTVFVSYHWMQQSSNSNKWTHTFFKLQYFRYFKEISTVCYISYFMQSPCFTFFDWLRVSQRVKKPTATSNESMHVNNCRCNLSTPVLLSDKDSSKCGGWPLPWSAFTSTI